MGKGIRIFGALLVAALLLASARPCAAQAADGTQPLGTAALAIDEANVYDGMAKAWSQGYIPGVSHGAATVVLPLVIDGASGVTAVKDNTITVTPDFGDPASSPFVFSNMERKVALAANPVNGGASAVQSWLVTLSLPLESGRVNGRYPLALQVSYSLPDGTACRQTFTLYVTIKDGVNPNATPKPAPTPKPTPKPEPQPKLIISRYAVTPEVVPAGSEFSLDFDIRNTSETLNVRNIRVTLKDTGDDLVPVSQSNTIYIDKLEKSATSQQSFRMKALFDAEPRPQKVSVAIDYEDGNGAVYSASDELTVLVTQPIRIEFDKPGIPAEVTAGDTVPVSLNVYNMGKNRLMNVMCRIRAPGLLPEGSAFLGNMDAGAGKTAEIFTYVGTLDMSLSDAGDIVKDQAVSELYGAASGFIVVSYEDEFGNGYSKQIELKTTIQEPAAPAPTPAPAEAAPAAAGQWWISVTIAGTVAAGIAAAMALLRRKRRREAAGGNEID